MIKNIFYCLLALWLVALMACNDPASIDTDLVNIDLLDIKIDDDFEIESYSTVEDSVIAFRSGFVLQAKYPFGIYEDPIFGKTESSIISQIYLTTTDAPDFSNAVLDSVVFELKLSETEPTYGDTLQEIGLEVYKITETLDAANNYYTNAETETESSPIGSYTGVPNYKDSVEVVRYNADTLLLDTFPPMIRFRLDNSYGMDIMALDSATINSPTDFLIEFKGIEIRPTLPASNLVAFDFADFTSRKNGGLRGGTIILFYTVDGIPKTYFLNVNPTSSAKYLQHKHDYTSSNVHDFLNTPSMGDSLIFVQGLTGVNAVISLNNIDKLDDVLVNGAVLEVYGTSLDNDLDIRPFPEQLVLREKDTNGELIYTNDFNSAALAANLSLSGGEPEDIGGGIVKYSFNIGSQLQDIIEGNAPNEVYIRTNAKVANMRRAVLFGAKHSTYPIKLVVTYTNL